MKFHTLLAMGSLLTGAAVGTPTPDPEETGIIQCHWYKDSIGNYCQFASHESFSDAAKSYCKQIEAQGARKQGSSSNIYYPNRPDGYGGQQTFWGNYRNDRGGDIYPKESLCMEYMDKIFLGCEGFGGWIETGFGTVFGECIRK